MKVILNDYVEHLGERGDVVDVKPGYARNYLLPKRLAYPDSPGNRRLFEQEQTRWEAMDLHRREAATKVAEQLEGVQLLFERRAGEKDVLFGSVTPHDIVAALGSRGVEVERRRVQLEHPIKALGTHVVPVKVHRDMVIDITVHVVRPGEEPNADPGPDEGAVAEAPSPDELAAEDILSDASPAEPPVEG